MPYVPNCKCDVFVSFAYLDDVAIGNGQPWVSAFAADLKKVLRMRLGVREEKGLEIYFTGHGSLEVGLKLDGAMMENARSAATFVAVTSPAYVAADSWTMRELAAFEEATGAAGRIFAIEHFPLDRPEDYPRPLRDVNRMAFWQKPPERDVPVTMTAGSEAYLQTLFDLAEQIRRQLKKMKEEAAKPPASPVAARMSAASPEAGGRAAGNGRTVFLAQVTDDLEEEREQVRRYLEQFGIAVLPDGIHSQGGATFSAAVEADLARADAFVQLLGRAHAKRPPDVPQGYDRLQAELAGKRGIPVLQWLRPDVDPAAIVDPAHAELVCGENVMRIGLEAFKADILKRTGRKTSTPPPPEQFVFIDADGSDSKLAEDLRREFRDANYSAAVPFLQGGSEEVRLDLEENIVECDALLMIYGEASPVWVRGQLRLYSKLKHRRRQPLKALAIYVGPPDAKPDIGMDMPECQQLDCRSGMATETVRRFLSGIHQ